jgi:S-DNA-T family DNA segregation ATPase FtsK/SpoIIIE
VIAGTDQERLTRLLGTLRTTIDERAVRYGKVGAGTITSYRQIAGAPDEPRILLLIDGMGAFRSAYEGNENARWFETFLGIAGDGRPVGVHVVVAADRPGAMPSKLNALVQRRVVLRLADPVDYTFLGVPNDVLDISSPPGRGVLLDSEVQVAVLGGKTENLDQTRAITGFATAMRNAGAQEAPSIAALADHVRLEDLPVAVDGMPVLGLSGVTLGPVSFEPRGTFSVAGPSGSGRTTALRVIVESLRRWNPDIRAFLFGSRRSPLQAIRWDKACFHATEAADLADHISSLVADGTVDGGPVVVVIEGVTDFVGCPGDLAMQQMVKALVADDQLVVSDGEATALNGAQPLVTACRASRIGIALQPESTDGLIFKVQFPRTRRTDFPPGRALMVPRGGQPLPVQVAM